MQRYSSSQPAFDVHLEEIDIYSGLKVRKGFVTENRAIYIHKSLEHLLSLQDVKINENHVQKIYINDQFMSQGTDEVR